MFEIGLIYKKEDHYYLAIGKEILLTAFEGEFQEIEPSVKYDVARRVSVANLCKNWGITPLTLDAEIRRYLNPDNPLNEDQKRDIIRRKAAAVA